MHWQRLSRNTYALISRLASEAGDGAAVRKRTKREARLVPGVIFRIEQFEGLLVRQSKKLKVDLTSQMRRSTARDFRIQLDRLPEVRARAPPCCTVPLRARGDSSPRACS